MPHVSTKEILVDGRKRGYGVASLMGSDVEMCVGLCKAAEDIGAPLLLVYNQEVNPNIPMEYSIPMMVNAAKQCKSPVGTVLDHGHSLEQAQKALSLGLNTIMFDASTLPYEENIARTREVVTYAHSLGATVEAELGSISGSAVDYTSSGPEAHYTDPDIAADYVQKTGVDFLAISFGNAHGIYHEPKIDLNIVRAVFKKVSIPLVMHGASGLAYDMYPQIIKAGITKVCYYTAMARSAVTDIMQCMSVGEKSAYHDIVACSTNYFYFEAKHLMRIFMSTGATARSAEHAVEILSNEVARELEQPVEAQCTNGSCGTYFSAPRA